MEKIVVDCETGEEARVLLTKDEKARRSESAKQDEARLQKEHDKATARRAVLTKLGLSDEEATAMGINAPV